MPSLCILHSFKFLHPVEWQDMVDMNNEEKENFMVVASDRYLQVLDFSN